MVSKVKLSGHSGCSIYAINDGKRIFVRKESASVEYNSRLEKQCFKQEVIRLPGVEITPVLSKGYINELFYFDMAYVNGVTLAEQLKNIGLKDILPMAEKLVEHINQPGAEDPESRKIFKDKTLSVLDSISHNGIVLSFANSDELELIRNCGNLLLEYDWKLLSPGLCHGDYTLENLILAENGKIYAIDFLDSFYDSWQIDVAKLLQDVELYWSYRYVGMDENTQIRLIVFRRCILEYVARNKGKEYIFSIYHVLLLNILRIFPYTKDEITFRHLIKNLNYLYTKVLVGF